MSLNLSEEFIKLLLSDDITEIAKEIGSNCFIKSEDKIRLILLAKLVNQIRLL